MGPRFLHVESQDQANRTKTLADITAKRAASASYMETLAASPGSRRQTHHATMYYRVYLSKDAPVAVGCLNEVQRRRLLELLELEDVYLESGFDPTSAEAVTYAQELTQRAEEIFAEKTSTEWLQILEDRGIPAGLVRFAEELFDDPQIHANGLLTEFEHRDAGTVKIMGPLAKFSDTALPEAGSSPALGQHSAEILAELGFLESDYLKWKQEGVVG